MRRGRTQAPDPAKLRTRLPHLRPGGGSNRTTIRSSTAGYRSGRARMPFPAVDAHVVPLPPGMQLSAQGLPGQARGRRSGTPFLTGAVSEGNPGSPKQSEQARKPSPIVKAIPSGSRRSRWLTHGRGVAGDDRLCHVAQGNLLRSKPWTESICVPQLPPDRQMLLREYCSAWRSVVSAPR